MLGELLFILGLVLINGVLAGSELAVVSLRGSRVQELVERGGRAAQAIDELRQNPERFLATVQIGISVVSAAAGAFGGAGFARYLVPFLEPFLGERAESAALGVAVAIISYLSLVLGELIPKSLGLRYADRYALVVARPLLGLSIIARPLVWLLTESSNLILRLFGDQTSFSESRLTPEELQRVVDEAGKAGTVHPHATNIASRALDFAGLTAVHVMVPRLHVVMVPRAASAEALRELILDRGQSRMPVYDGDREHAVGYVSLRDLMRQLLQGDSLSVANIIRPAPVVAESMRAVELLEAMRRDRDQLAIVVDEQGAMTGIVTMEDLLKELVGEYAWERDDQGPVAIVREPDGAARVLGEVPLRDVNRELGLSLPEGPEYSTIAGLCLTLAAGIPVAGERFTAPDGTVLEVLDATPRRVRRLRVRPPSTASE